LSRRISALGIVATALLVATTLRAQTLDENCVVNVLNRTVQVSHDGSWVLPNVPSNMGRIRARATCTQGNQTISGQTDYFNVQQNAVNNVGAILFEQQEPVPVSLVYTDTAPIVLSTVGAAHQLAVRATYPDGSVRVVNKAADGVNYTSTNAGVASVTADGVVTALTSGVVLITARKDEVVALMQINVNVAGDKDHDGLPDDFEQANGLDPNDPIDAQEDQDQDGLTALQEFQRGTNLRVADSDGDGLSDGEEVAAGADGFVTNPLNADTDGDGLRDGLEVLAGSSPTDPNDRNLEGALDRIEVSPATVDLVFNGIQTEVSTPLHVTGILIDGNSLDLTARSSGTNYASSDLSIVSFGTTDGEIFGGRAGTATVTVTNSGKQFNVAVTVEAFAPVVLSAIDMPGYANNVDVAGDYAYVAAGAAGLQVVDISDRKHPAIVASLDTDGVAIDVRVVGDFVYVADGQAGLQIVNIANPLQPQLVGHAQTGGIAQDVKVEQGFAYVADGPNGITIVDVSVPTQPITRGHVGDIGNAVGIDVQGTRGVVVAGSSIHVFDLTDRAAPAIVGSAAIGGAVRDVVLRDNYAYVAASALGYRIVNIADAAAPAVIAGDASFVPNDVELVENFAFFAEQLFPNVIALVNAENPERPIFQAIIDLAPLGDYAGTGISLDGSYAYVTEESFVVRDPFGVTGSTRLFIAQYRRIVDTQGVPPTVTIHPPERGLIEGQTLDIKVDASDDVGVHDVRLAVNGAAGRRDTTQPYRIPIDVPLGASSATLVATATDLGGNVGTAQLVVPVLADTDRDALADDAELTLYHTDPNDADTDDDTLSDGREIALGTNPLAADSDGDGIGDAQEIAAGTDPRNPDVTRPTVVATDPVDGAHAVPENGPVRVTFSEPLQPRSINQQVLRVRKVGGDFAPGVVQLMPNGLDLVFTPTGVLDDFTDYDVIVEGVRDLAGNAMDAGIQFSYQTGNVEDHVPPTLVGSSPFAGATVGTNATLTLVMSEPINPLSITATNFTLQDDTAVKAVPVAVSVGADAITITVVPNAALPMRHNFHVSMVGIKDLFGNPSGLINLSFNTSFTPDATPPRVVATSLPDGLTSAPLNATLAVRFDEAINRLKLGGIVLRQAGTVLSTQRNVIADAAGTVVTLVPTQVLAPNTSYLLSVVGVEDLSGNALAAPVSVSFTTGAVSDTTGPTIVGRTPPASATGVPRNPVIEAQFNERLNPVTVNSTSVTLTAGGNVPGSVSLSSDGTVVRFTPSSPLEAQKLHSYSVSTTARDLAGNIVNVAATQFNTGSGVDASAPLVQLQSIADGASAVPVNGRFVLFFDAPLADRCLTAQTVQLTSNGTVIPTTRTLSTDRRTLTITPQAALSANSAYTLRLQGVCDLAGNTLDNFTSGFTTSPSATPDTTAPSVTITPAQNATNVPVTTPIVFNFNEPMDVTTLAGAIQVSAQSAVAGTLSVNGNVVTFTPLDPLPGARGIAVTINGARDLAGNQLPNTVRQFTTGAAGDTHAPQVLSIVPNDGLIDVAPTTPIVLTFSESLDPSTVSNDTIVLFVNGAIVRPSISTTTDNRTVMLTTTMPAASLVAVIVTNDVRDLSGNAMSDFVSAFTTAVPRDGSVPQVRSQFPGNAASNVLPDAPITLYLSEPMNTATLNGALHVAQNGVPVSGTATFSADGQAITFRANAPYAGGGAIEVFLDNTALDVSGNPLFNYQGSFTIAPNPATAVPTVLAYGPNFAGPLNQPGGPGSPPIVPVNVVIDVLLSEPLDPTSINNNSVSLKVGTVAVAVNVSLRAGNRVLRVRPQAPLAANTFHQLQLLTTIRDAGGQSLPTQGFFNFFTSTIDVPDTVAPRVLGLSPPTGAQNVGINALVHARFDEPVNPFTIGLTPQQTSAFGSVLWSDNYRQVRFVRHTPYATGAQVSESVAGAEDFSGNVAAAPASTTFTTGAGPDLTGSDTVVLSPPSGTANVPINGIVRVLYPEQVDPITVNDTALSVRDSTLFQPMSVSLQLEPDGRTVTIVPPSGAYPLGHLVSVSSPGVLDLAGNPLANFNGANFNTALIADTQAPTVVAVSIPDQASAVSTNAVVQVFFSEPFDDTHLDGVTLRRDGVPVPATLLLSGDRRTITFKFLQPLAPSASYVLSVSGVRDLAGNVLAADRVVSFTTETGVDALVPTIVSTSPANGATGVPRNTLIEIRYSERMNFISMLQNATLRNNATLQFVAGTISTSPDGRSLRFAPTQPLDPNRNYSLTANGITDLSGNVANTSVVFTTGATSDATPAQVLLQSIADGATGVAVNGRIVLQFDSALAPQCVNSQTVQLLNGGVTVAGTIALSTDRTRLTFTPQAALATNTSYTLRLQGLCDNAGNITTLTTGFVTSTSATPDTAGPTVTMVPAPNSTNVPVTSAVTLTYNEPIDVTTLAASIHVSTSGNDIAGTLTVNGNVVTFTPLNPFPGAKTINVQTSGVTDLAGNSSGFSFNFTTGAAGDVTAPQLLSVSPTDGLIDVATSTPIVLTFSESLDPASVTTANLTLFANGAVIVPTISRSQDNRTVVLTATVPAASIVSIIATSDLRDLSGNRLTDFVSAFTTAAATDTVRPTITAQLPASGASNVRRTANINLFSSEPLVPGTVAGALHVAQDGTQVEGTFTLAANGRQLTFHPNQQWAAGARIEVFLDNNATDAQGNALQNYTGNFTVRPNQSVVHPVPTTFGPATSGVPINAPVDMLFNKPLDPASVNSTNVVLRDTVTSQVIAADVSLIRQGRVVRVQPLSPLTASRQHAVTLDRNLRDLDGNIMDAGTAFFFTTATTADTQPPHVTRMSPPNGSTGVGLNAQVHALFDEPMNPVSIVVDAASGGTLFWTDSNRELRIVWQESYPASAEITESVEAAQDFGGNPVVAPFSSTFTTGEGPDLAFAVLLDVTPFQSATNVPVNALLRAVVNEQVDPITVNATSVRLQDAGATLGSIATLEPDGRSISIVPAQPLPANRTLNFNFTGVRDLAGNFLPQQSPSFTTGSAADTQAPTIASTTVLNGQTGVALNTSLQVRFDEAVNSQKLGGVVLKRGAQPVVATLDLSSDHKTITFKLAQPLVANSAHTIEVAGVQDLSGNELTPAAITFTTGTHF
jgi:large repetitive protein